MSPRVFNRHYGAPEDAVYVGRGSGWGNPFRIGPGGTREQVVRDYRDWLWSRPGIVAHVQQELRGKDLVCNCKPKLCHADVLLEMANLDPLI